MVLLCRQWRQRQATYMADDGQAPPLYIKVPPETHPWGWWQGAEGLEPCEMRRWKATAVSLTLPPMPLLSLMKTVHFAFCIAQTYCRTYCRGHAMLFEQYCCM